MNLINIYISLKEAEDLTFKRLLIIRCGRLDVNKAQGLFSVSVEVDKDELIEIENEYVLLFSSVLHFQIPEKDSNLFLNHYLIPKGLLQLVGRNSRDTTKQKSGEIDYPSESNDVIDYLRLRNGLLGVMDYFYRYHKIIGIPHIAENLFTNFANLSKFKFNFIKDISKGDIFPILEVKLDKYVSDKFFRITWWGKFIGDNLLADYEDNLCKTIKDWLKFFLDKRSLEQINDHLKNRPLELIDELEFLIGYYFAAYNYEYMQNEEESIERLFIGLQHEKKEELFFWLIFFKSVFNENINSLFFINSLRNQVYNLEKLAFNMMREDYSPIEFEFKVKILEKKDLIVDYLNLSYGGENTFTEIIDSDAAVNVFKNNLKVDNLNFIGLEKFGSSYFEHIFPNLSWQANGKFNLILSDDIDTSLITFYLDKNSLVQEKLKSLKIKVKPTASLIDKSKKVLIAFFKNEREPKLFNLYTNVLKKEIESNFDKVVIVLLTNSKVGEIQSLEFNNRVKEVEREIKMQLKVKADVIVKNETTLDDSEIKRNLKNVLKNYKINQMEVVNGNFDLIKASWLLEVNSEFFIYDENVNYYSFWNRN